MKTGSKQKLQWVLLSVVFIQLFMILTTLWAAPKSADEASLVVEGWLYYSNHPLDEDIGQEVLDVDTFTGADGNPLFYVVNLIPSGFVIVSSDDLIEPIIAFANDGVYENSLENPLGALVNKDLQQRMVDTKELETGIKMLSVRPSTQDQSPTQAKWKNFLRYAEDPFSTKQYALSDARYFSINDMRVSPLTQSRWNQTICSYSPRRACYNYYTPLVTSSGSVNWSAGNSENAPCGCVATAMAQLMFYHRYPQQGVGMKEFEIGFISSQNIRRTGTRCLKGGDEQGGPYQWDYMVNVPDYTTNSSNRKAIGALCHDAGVSVNMDYGINGSGAYTYDTADALKDTFLYSNSVAGMNLIYDLNTGNLQAHNIGSDLNDMVNPNLDAGYPVILGIQGPDGGHAVLADGYGYQYFTIYHHLNMGLLESDDAWYNLPSINGSYDFTTIHTCVYNIFPSRTGEIISGRVLNRGIPVSGVRVQTEIETWIFSGEGRNRIGWKQSETISDITDDNGIFALVGIPSNYTCTIEVIPFGYLMQFESKTVTTGYSKDFESDCGNVWEVNLSAM